VVAATEPKSVSEPRSGVSKAITMHNNPTPELDYSVEERAEMITRMKLASNIFYSNAVKIGNHPWIEFTGLLNEYIKMCEQAQAQGIDFPNANAHSGIALPMRTFEAAYIGEKLGCIFGPSLQKPENGRAFLEKVGLPIPELFRIPSPER